MHQFDVEQVESGLIAPVEEFTGGPVISLACVGVADIGGKEFDEAPPGSGAARIDQPLDGPEDRAGMRAGSWSLSLFMASL